MNVLLDTVTFLWIGEGSTRLSETARSTIVDPSNRLFLSAISVWEVQLKTSLGKLPLPADPTTYVRRIREARAIASLDFTEDDASHIATLPFHHRDPFGRALVSQALARSLVLLTPDPDIHTYGIRALW